MNRFSRLGPLLSREPSKGKYVLAVQSDKQASGMIAENFHLFVLQSLKRPSGFEFPSAGESARSFAAYVRCAQV